MTDHTLPPAPPATDGDPGRTVAPDGNGEREAVPPFDEPELIRAPRPTPVDNQDRDAVFGPVDLSRIERAVREILIAIGEDPERDGLQQTPARVARMYAEVFAGLREAPDHHLQVLFEANHDEMVMVRDISLTSMCEHHLVPFVGKAHVAYIPGDDGRVTGLSKLARLVDAYAKRPQVQERLTAQIADEIERTLQPKGVLVVIEAEHLCMSMRGVKKPGAVTVTSAVRGLFRDNTATRFEAMRFIDGSRS